MTWGKWDLNRTAPDGSWPAQPLNAEVYADHFPPGRRLADMPAAWWRKIEWRYPDGKSIVSVYEREPEPDEIRALMWFLQSRAGEIGSQITVTDADGSSTDAPAIRG